MKMVGAGGKDHCSVINCLEPAHIRQTFKVYHPDQTPRDVTYWLCTAHLGNSPGAEKNKNTYGNFYLQSQYNYKE